MKTTKILGLAILLVAAGCTGEPSTTSPRAAASAQAPAENAVERAIRSVELGRDLGAARVALEGALADESLSDELRDDAALALARALDALGDKEAAIARVEDLIEARFGRNDWPQEKAADALLEKLVTGRTDHAGLRTSRNSTPTAAPVARALAKTFPQKATSASIAMIFFGGDDATSAALGTFHVAEALRLERQEACPLCEEDLSISRSSSRHGRWTGIPAERPNLGKALVVYYVDLDAFAIPARYHAGLPVAYSEIEGRLGKGEGVIVVGNREGAPPVIVLGAPREAQWPDVEAAFAKMTALPDGVVSVALRPDVRPGEIRAALGGARADLARCADALHGRAKDATGKVVLRFGIDGTGRVVDPRASTADTSLDAPFLTCVDRVVGGLAFPASGRSTTVSYPLTIAP